MTNFAPGTLHRVTHWFNTYRTPTAMLGSVIKAGTVFMVISEEIVAHNNIRTYTKAHYRCLSSDGTIWCKSWQAKHKFELNYPETGTILCVEPVGTP